MTISNTAQASGKALLDARETAAATLVEAARKACRAANDTEATDKKIAERWSVALSLVSRLFTATSGVNITLAKVLALHPRLAREILVRALAAVDEADPSASPSTRDTLDRVGIELGQSLTDYVRDVHDGREDDHAVHEANLVRLVGTALRGLRGIQRRREEAAR